ncbi:unnamed protein product [Prorocentrum cordatum]|uniref:SEA domain-containing protein n=1 Tax=Prorocentrum cordatum TaxID=2364126 RepID=A0ABN9UZV5_9DINO|nr:unnamed protein product [Polarella glacialis]
MVVQNVDYDSLLANSTIMESFKLACAEAVAAQAGQGIAASDVYVTVYDGSVIVSALVTVPDTSSAATVADNLGSFDSLADAVLQAVQAVPGIVTVQTGAIGVIQTTTTTALGSTTLPHKEDEEGTVNVASVVMFGLGVICVGGVCGVVLARATRRKGEVSEFCEVFDVASPKNTQSAVTQKLFKHVVQGKDPDQFKEVVAVPSSPRPSEVPGGPPEEEQPPGMAQWAGYRSAVTRSRRSSRTGTSLAFEDAAIGHLVARAARSPDAAGSLRSSPGTTAAPARPRPSAGPPLLGRAWPARRPPRRPARRAPGQHGGGQHGGRHVPTAARSSSWASQHAASGLLPAPLARGPGRARAARPLCAARARGAAGVGHPVVRRGGVEPFTFMPFVIIRSASSSGGVR